MKGFAGFPTAPPSQLASSSPLPSYLARHAHLGFDNDDVAALISSIDASQRSSASSASQLPAELLLQILEYIPVDYVLDWRLVCRGFRDAIDGQIMFKHLQRTQLIGYIGEREAEPLNSLSDENYDRLHLLRANFMNLDYRQSNHDGADGVSPAWTGTHAVFEIEERWYEACRSITGAKAQNGYALMDITPRWMDALERLELQLPEEGYGSLRWCIKLDHAVLDLDIPLEVGKTSFDVAIDLSTKTIRVAWKKMLFRFLKSENALRKLMHKTMHSNFTFSYLGDCLRAVRRARLFAALDPNDKLDRHLIWSMRLLHPLFGLPCHNHNVALSHVENNAVDVLMLLRREAAMTDHQILYLRQLNEDRVAMERQLIELEEQFREFKGHMSAPGYVFTLPLSTTVDSALPHNPIAWPDDMRASIEDRVGKWRDQKKVIAQLHALLTASNQALGVPQNSFDLLSSDLSFAL